MHRSEMFTTRSLSHLFEYTFKLVKELMIYKTKVGNSLQTSLIIPYLGTSLYFEAIEND